MKKKNILIHTTGNFENLKNILTSKSLKLSYSSENFSWKNKLVSKAAHPMVCFSEYDPETINDQRITYGKYAVGFSKEWAREKNIGPVLYVSNTSVAAKGMNTLLKARRNKADDGRLQGKIRLAIMEVKCFMKNEKGFNSFTKDEDFDFKSENEWRYVPQKSELENYFISQNQKTYEKYKISNNKRLEKYPLTFELSNLEAVYVPSQDEKRKITDLIGIDKNIIKISKWAIK